MTPSDPATVSNYRLDKYEVTVGRFRRFMEARKGGWVPPPGSGKHAHLNAGKGLSNGAQAGAFEPGWAASDNDKISPSDKDLTCASRVTTWTPAAAASENMPINCVNWYEAYAFCIWDGGFLPSEAEWQYAAAGGKEQRQYPWGATPPGKKSQYAIYGCFYKSDAAACAGRDALKKKGFVDSSELVNLAPVGTATLGAGLWGQLDLSGNAQELMLDWSSGSLVVPCADCANLTEGSTGFRVTRIDRFGDPPFDTLYAERFAHVPEGRHNDVGFRCARSP